MKRHFGKIVAKPNRKRAHWLEASFASFGEHGVVCRKYKTFRVWEREQAELWLAEMEEQDRLQRSMVMMKEEYRGIRDSVQDTVTESRGEKSGVDIPVAGATTRLYAYTTHMERRVLDMCGVDKQGRVVLPENVTMTEFFVVWFPRHTTSRGLRLKEQSRYRLFKDIKNHVLPVLGEYRVADITNAQADLLLASIPEEQNACKVNALKVLKLMLNSAVKGEPTVAPCIERHFVSRNERLDAAKHQPIICTPEMVIELAEAMPEKLKLTVLMSYFCGGLRIGEVCGLHSDDCDLEQRVLHIRRGRIASEQTVDTPKSERSVRDLRIPEQLVPMIRKHIRLYVGERGWLFSQLTDQTKPLYQSTLRRKFDGARKKVGLDTLRFHDLRHSSLTRLAQQGATVEELMMIAGHSSPEIAMRYQHATSERISQMMNTLGEQLAMQQSEEEQAEAVRQIVDNMDSDDKQAVIAAIQENVRLLEMLMRQ